jgi:hypothetical protein
MKVKLPKIDTEVKNGRNSEIINKKEYPNSPNINRHKATQSNKFLSPINPRETITLFHSPNPFPVRSNKDNQNKTNGFLNNKNTINKTNTKENTGNSSKTPTLNKNLPLCNNKKK